MPDWVSPCGRVQLYCGDGIDVLRSLPPNSVDMIWTDPPFGHGNMDGDLQAARVRDGVDGARVKPVQAIANDKGDDFDSLMVDFLDAASIALKRDCCCCCCCCMAGGGPNVTFARVSKWIDERLEFFQAIVWDKSARGNGMGWRYRRNYEFVMVAHRKGGKLLWADDSTAVPNIVRHSPVLERVHPNEKPVDMVEDFISWHSGDEDDLIVDPFMGSGSTGVACVHLGRRFIGCELDAGHFETARDRIAHALGHETVKNGLKQRRMFVPSQGGE